jgi:amidase
LLSSENLRVNANAKGQALDTSQRGPLFGIPVETADMVTAFGSRACKDYVPAKDATLVKRLRDAGAVILGKSTMPDWAASWFSTSSLSETTKNPYDLKREPGGSSSGSGAAVAAGMALAAIGGDTGGSIRLPSSFCGLVGVRVTPGRISRDGMSALVQYQDTPGPMTYSVEDAARILDVIVGFDERDDYTSVNAVSPLTGSETPFQNAIKKPSLHGKRLGVLRQAFGNDKSIQAVLSKSLQALVSSGATLIDISTPDLEHYKSRSSAYVLRSKADINAFCASRPALSHLKLEDLHAAGEYHKALDLIDAVVKGPSDYKKNVHYTEAILVREEFQRVVATVFAREKLDAVVYPTCQVLPPRTEDVLSAR